MAGDRLLVIAGSARAGSFNRRLAAVAAGAARQAGAAVTELDLGALDLPVYSAEIEAAGLPMGAVELRRQFAQHDALLISAPEYNGFPTPLLINALDWASRVPAADGLPAGTAAIKGLVAGLVSASPGAMGGLRGLMSLRHFLGTGLGMLVVPDQFALGGASAAFDAQGALTDTRQAESLKRVVDAMLRTSRSLKVALTAG